MEGQSPFFPSEPDPGEVDAFFTIGMQDELTAQLANLAGIKVIGAQSTRSFAPGAPRDLAAIGRELSVRHLLEGSVWRANGQLRIGLHLVDLQRPEKGWNESYERPVTQIFSLQSEIAHAIAAQLDARISAGETAALDKPPTNNLETTILLARDYHPEAGKVPPKTSPYERRIALLDQAVARDPAFVLAYCELAQSHDRIYREKIATSAGKRVSTTGPRGSSHREAMRIAPDAGRLHLAVAQHFSPPMTIPSRRGSR
jgi:TolB-like protein